MVTQGDISIVLAKVRMHRERPDSWPIRSAHSGTRSRPVPRREASAACSGTVPDTTTSTNITTRLRSTTCSATTAAAEVLASDKVSWSGTLILVFQLRRTVGHATRTTPRGALRFYPLVRKWRALARRSSPELLLSCEASAPLPTA